MYELIQEALRMGAVAVSLEVRVTNWGAQRMYGALRVPAGRDPQELLPGDRPRTR